MGDLKTAIQGAVKAGFDALDSCSTQIVIVYGSGAYDPVTGTTAAGTQTAAIRGFRYDASESQSVESSGYEAIALMRDEEIQAAGLTADIIRQANKAIIDGETWEIVRVGYDSIRCCAKLFLRHG